MLRSSNSDLRKELDPLVEWVWSVMSVWLWERRLKNYLGRALALKNRIPRNEEVPGYL